MATEPQVTFEFECVDMPGDVFGEWHHVRLGIQEGKIVVDDVPGSVPSAVFRFVLRVKAGPKNGAPNLLGPHAQGKPGQRFVYLCWGERRDNVWHGFRRAKVQLGHLSWDDIQCAVESGQPIRARISMTGTRGEPVAATVKPEQIEWI
ncbi:MAG: hypothetical protein JXA89_19920 [Anaerolineae bacterium]|nr:hypothetical protein [Anaerolineae bacterium]